MPDGLTFTITVSGTAATLQTLLTTSGYVGPANPKNCQLYNNNATAVTIEQHRDDSPSGSLVHGTDISSAGEKSFNLMREINFNKTTLKSASGSVSVKVFIDFGQD